MGAKRIPLFIDEFDSGVPDGYIPLFDLLTKPEYALAGYDAERWCLGKTKFKELKIKTFKTVRSEYENVKASNFARYWNSNIDAINALGLNEFSKIKSFSELSKIMICFIEKVITRNNTKRYYVSFGVNREMYEKYRNSLQIAFENGTIPEKVRLYDKRKRKSTTARSTQRTGLWFDTNVPNEKRYVEIHKNEIFMMFEKWCELKGKTKKSALYDAMLMIMEKDPAQGMNTKKSEYSSKSILNTSDYYLNENDAKYKKVGLKIPEQIIFESLEIVGRWNLDPENIGKKKLSLSNYAAQALKSFNKSVSLKYSDPFAYKEYLEIKENQIYNITGGENNVE